MTLSDQIPATSVNSAYWAVLQGRLAAANGAGAEANRYAGGSEKSASVVKAALALCWAYGSVIGAADNENKADDTVSRGTSHPGRGRGRLGPRAEWRPEQIEVLRLARAGGQGHLSDRDLAGIVDKSHDAVRARLARGRRSVATAHAPPHAGRRPGDPIAPRDGGPV